MSSHTSTVVAQSFLLDADSYAPSETKDRIRAALYHPAEINHNSYEPDRNPMSGERSARDIGFLVGHFPKPPRRPCHLGIESVWDYRQNALSALNVRSI
jgi:hypothetical protein